MADKASLIGSRISPGNRDVDSLRRARYIMNIEPSTAESGSA